MGGVSSNQHDQLDVIIYLCKYFPCSRAFSLIMYTDYRVYAQPLRQSRAVVASGCAFLACMGAYQVENIYKDELYHDIKIGQTFCLACYFFTLVR